MLLSVGADNFLFLWDIRQNKVIQKLLAHPEPITALDISFDSTMIVTAAYDGYVRLWDTHKATCIKTIVSETGSTSAVSACKLTPNSHYIFIANMNGQLGMYDLQSNLVKAYLGHSNAEYCIDLCLAKMNNLRSGRTALLTGSEDGRLCGWDLMSQKVILNKSMCPEVVQKKPAPASYLAQLKASPMGKSALSA